MRATLVAILLAVAALPAVALEAPDSLRARIDAALAAPALRGARVGVRVETVRGRLVYERSGDLALVPASNQKLLTALAAFRVLGPTHRFETQILADRLPDAEGAVDRLYVRGGGDPALTSEDLWRLAADLRRAGLRSVRRGVVLDDSLFDSERWNPAWGPVSARAYYAPVGALTVNYGAYAVIVGPGSAPGDAPEVAVDPPLDYFRVGNRARTGPTRGSRTLQVERRSVPDGEEIQVRGALPTRSDTQTIQRSVLDPARYAGALLVSQLAAVGVSVQGEVRPGGIPLEAVQLLSFPGAPLSDVIRRFLKYSNNQIGESLVKGLGARATGRPGSWSNGMAAVRAELEAAGLPLAGAVLVDGSGLSHENRASPRLLVAALRVADGSFEYGPEYEAALPIAAADGTLQERAEAARARVRAKTGLLTRVTSLSGYAQSADGERLVFSILVNGFRGSASSAMRAVDGFAAALVTGSP
jgi:D-alanyl-D-alanine carboxypeptidase/D-alanyl-D-alanine-endopeptidase (penicillin-binding protein 4)